MLILFTIGSCWNRTGGPDQALEMGPLFSSCCPVSLALQERSFGFWALPQGRHVLAVSSSSYLSALRIT